MLCLLRHCLRSKLLIAMLVRNTGVLCMLRQRLRSKLLIAMLAKKKGVLCLLRQRLRSKLLIAMLARKKGRALPALTTSAIKITGCKACQNTSLHSKQKIARLARTKGVLSLLQQCLHSKLLVARLARKKRACSACFKNVCDQNY